MTKHHSLDGLYDRKLCLTVLGAGESKIKVSAGLECGEDCLPGSRMTTLCP